MSETYYPRHSELDTQADRELDAAQERIRQLETQIRTVAERQREACACDLGDWLGMLFHNADGGRSPIPHAEIEAIRRMVRATPLVTEGEP